MTRSILARRRAAQALAMAGAALALGASACHRSPGVTPDAPSVKTIGGVGFDEPELRLGSAPVAILSEVASPAGVTVDWRRDRLAVTSMQGNSMYLVPLH